MNDDTKPTPLHPLVCARCQRPITRGSRYCEVTTPAGEVPVHLACLETEKKP